MWNETIEMVATSILSTFRDCQTKIRSMAGFGKKKLMTTKDFAHGSRIPSTTPIRHSAVTVPTPFSRENDPLFSCVPASLANLVYDVDKRFATWVAEKTPNTFRNLREFANFLQHAGSIEAGSRATPFKIIPCLPANLRSLTPRDPLYRPTLKETCKGRLDWILGKEEGKFLVVVVASDSHANHVIGVDAERQIIFDHEVRNSLPLSQEGFDGTCGGSTTCIGLAEIREVASQYSKKRTRST
jgi:hypothetical protein